MDCFVGIDVAFAKRKCLPIVVSVWEDGRLVPLRLRDLGVAPPRGRGNAAAVRPDEVEQFADEARSYLVEVFSRCSLRPKAIAIDAPRLPRPDHVMRRAAEVAMDRASISCFTTPSTSDWLGIFEKVKAHLADGGAPSRLPHANQLWMLPGFELFRRLADLAPVLEVFPQAIARAIGAGAVHKSREGAVEAQLAAAARYTGWPASKDETRSLRRIAWAPRHDCLDAYLASWVAALDEGDRVAHGEPPDDVIWVPRCRP